MDVRRQSGFAGLRMRPVRLAETTNDLDTGQASLLAYLPDGGVAVRLAWIDPAGGHLRTRVGLVTVFEDEQLDPAVVATGDVARDTLPGQIGHRPSLHRRRVAAGSWPEVVDVAYRCCARRFSTRGT